MRLSQSKHAVGENRPRNALPSSECWRGVVISNANLWIFSKVNWASCRQKQFNFHLTALQTHSGVAVLLHVVKPAVKMPTIVLLLEGVKVNPPETHLTATQVNIWQQGAGKALQVCYSISLKLERELFWCPGVLLWLLKKKIFKYCCCIHIKY